MRVICLVVILISVFVVTSHHAEAQPETTPDQETLTQQELDLIRAVEKARIQTIEKVVGSVIAVYGEDRQGGGSGVIIDPSGIALTNHHVIMGAGVSGLGGLADGNLYKWELVGTDPGGDVAVIQLSGKEQFPFSPLGDSDKVHIGDFALAMGNPFLLAHDQFPTVTLGIVSGVERYQEGAGQNQLVYGNCIQIDSSINPGNSGGPLFNMQGEVIGINGRGSFRDRGRVNVGLGYAISSNQIRNFIPDLLATKLIEHGTLDASFTDRDGKVVCSTINLDAPVARAGLELGDRLVEFEGRAISYSNQFTNMICTLPEDWPAHLVIEKPNGERLSISVRLFGLPYNISIDDGPTPRDDGGDKEEKEKEEDSERGDPQKQEKNEDAEKPDSKEQNPGDDERSGKDNQEGEPEEKPAKPGSLPDQSQKIKRAQLKALLRSEPGVVLKPEINKRYVTHVFDQWRRTGVTTAPNDIKVAKFEDKIFASGEQIGQQTIWIASDGRLRVEVHLDGEQQTFGFDGGVFWKGNDGEQSELTLIEAKTNPLIVQALAVAAPMMAEPFAPMGSPSLDGGDKAKGRLAYRLMYLDEDDDWFYCWLSLYGESGAPQVRLLKVASHRDCAGDSKGVVFGQWRDVDGVEFPFEKRLVSGLHETVAWTAQTQSCLWLEKGLDELFEISE